MKNSTGTLLLSSKDFLGVWSPLIENIQRNRECGLDVDWMKGVKEKKRNKYRLMSYSLDDYIKKNPTRQTIRIYTSVCLVEFFSFAIAFPP